MWCYDEWCSCVFYTTPRLPEGYADIKQSTQANKNMHNKAHKLLFSCRMKSTCRNVCLSGISSESHENISHCLWMFASLAHVSYSMRLILYARSLLLTLLQQPPLSLIHFSSPPIFIRHLFFFFYAQHTKHSILAVSAVAEIAVNEKRSPFIFFILPLLSACSL